MRSARISFLLLALLPAVLWAQSNDPASGLAGRIEGATYISPTGTFRIPVPVLPELGGTVADTDNVVTFHDAFNVHISIGAFRQDATQRWELSTRGLKDYLTYFFATYVMPDFKSAYPGGTVESVVFAPSIGDGALVAYTLLPGGSMFGAQREIFGADETPPVAKRGNLVFVRNNVIYVVTSELAERVTEGKAYKKTTAEENQILRERLIDIMKKMVFSRPIAP